MKNAVGLFCHLGD